MNDTRIQLHISRKPQNFRYFIVRTHGQDIDSISSHQPKSTGIKTGTYIDQTKFDVHGYFHHSPQV